MNKKTKTSRKLKNTRKHRKGKSIKHRKVKSIKHRKGKNNKNIYYGGHYQPAKFTHRNYGDPTPPDYYVKVHGGNYKDSQGYDLILDYDTNGVISSFSMSGYGVQLTEGRKAGKNISVECKDVDHNPKPWP